MAVKAVVAVKWGAVEALLEAVEAETRELVDEDRRIRAVVDALKAIFGEESVREVERGEECEEDEVPAIIRTRGYVLETLMKMPYRGVWDTGIAIWLKDYSTDSFIMIESPRRPWDVEVPGEGDPQEPRAILNQAILKVLRTKLEGFLPFAHVARRCPDCGEATKVRFGLYDPDVPIYVFVEETYPCKCEDP